MLRDLDLPLSRAQIASIVEAQDAPLALWSGAVSSGKTIASLIAFLLRLVAAPDHGLIVIVGRTLQTIERNLIDPLQSTYLFGPLAKHVHHTTGSTTATILGRTVHLIGASDSRAEGRIRGSTIALAYVDEATLVPYSFWMMLLSRLRVGDQSRLLATTNPDGPFHWLRKEFILRAPQVGLTHWHFTLDDNPSLDPGMVTRLKAQYTGLWYRRFILGDWCLAAGAVYEMFDRERHIVKTMPRIERWLCDAIDYGTVNPYADLLLGLGRDPETQRSRLYVVSEYRHDSRRERRQMTDSEYSRARRSWLARVPQPETNVVGVAPEWTIVDPSASSYIEQLHRDGVSGVTAADNSVIDGIRTVSSLLSTGDLAIHESAAGLVEELPSYSWDSGAAERGEDKPIKENDHSCDALRYGVRTTEALWRPYLPTRLEVAA